jgi:signal transduction histidine kinase
LMTDFLQTIIGESERLTALLDDVLQLSRIESGRYTLHLEPVELSALIRRVAERTLAPAGDALTLELDLPPALPAVVDGHAVVQVLVNLLDNARKYSPPGAHVRVRALVDGEIRLIVEDTGVGIPAADLERIFERFYRVDKARSRTVGGTGLGLAIVKHLVELHGGQVEVTSEMGVGSRFTITLPLPAAHPPEDEGAPGA